MRLPPLPLSAEPGPVPRVFHQLWIGSPPPLPIRESWAAWDRYLDGTDFAVHRWTDENPPPLYEAVTDLPLSRAGQADLLRLALLAMHGGVYADSDLVPTQPLEDQEWWASPDPWIGVPHTDQDKKLTISNGFCAFPPGHPFLGSVWAYGQRALNRGVVNPHFVAGPRAFGYAQRFHPIEVVVTTGWTDAAEPPATWPVMHRNGITSNVVQ